MKYKFFYLIFSLLVMLPGFYFIAKKGLNLSIDFTGGIVLNYKIPENPSSDLPQKITEAIVAIDPYARVTFTSDTFGVSTKLSDSDNLKKLRDSINSQSEGIQEVSSEIVGPAVGKETTTNALVSLFWACGGILLYIAYAFRSVPKPFSSFRFAVSAIIAMLHDALVLLGVYTIFGHFGGYQIDALFITAVLTVIGFSVHDTIVVFDRIRENLSKLPRSWEFQKIVDFSILETLNRSIATSLTVIITLFSLFVLGGESVKHFVLALLIGIISGTYSSIFTASPILILWEDFIRMRRLKK